MFDVYNLFNLDLVEAFKKKDIESIKQISSKSIFLIPVKDKNDIKKISIETMMDNKKSLYLPIFINMADVESNKMIKGKQILIAHFGMIEQILKNNQELKGIVINPCTMDCKLNRIDSLEICDLYNKNESKLNFEPDFYKKESFTMADLKTKELIPRAEIIVGVVDYLKNTTIKKAYLKIKPIGDKLNYKFFIDYNKKEQSFIDELCYIIEKLLQEKETFEILNAKKGMNVKTVRFLKPIYEKRK